MHGAISNNLTRSEAQRLAVTGISALKEAGYRVTRPTPQNAEGREWTCSLCGEVFFGRRFECPCRSPEKADLEVKP
jgi:hypothetical protein